MNLLTRCSSYSLCTYLCLDQDSFPVGVYFALDTSESVALRDYPWGSLVEKLKIFVTMFSRRLEASAIKSEGVQWTYGGLHFSDHVEVFSPVTSDVTSFLRETAKVRYIGRGTFIDCALRNVTEQVRRSPGGKPRLQYAVVLTDGHSTGRPCGGVQQAAEAARAAGIRLFVVATDVETSESDLKQIASSPAELYRKDYMVFPDDRRQAAIDRIVDTIVRQQ